MLQVLHERALRQFIDFCITSTLKIQNLSLTCANVQQIWVRSPELCVTSENKSALPARSKKMTEEATIVSGQLWGKFAGCSLHMDHLKIFFNMNLGWQSISFLWISSEIWLKCSANKILSWNNNKIKLQKKKKEIEITNNNIIFKVFQAVYFFCYQYKTLVNKFLAFSCKHLHDLSSWVTEDNLHRVSPRNKCLKDCITCDFSVRVKTITVRMRILLMVLTMLFTLAQQH